MTKQDNITECTFITYKKILMHKFMLIQLKTEKAPKSK